MNELSLFTGAGGGLLGSKLLGWKHVGYVEWDEYCQQVIAKRIKDGHLDEAPIFSDIDSLVSDGYAESYKGMVDVVTGGFPCTSFSVAGKREADKSHHNKWPATRDVISAIKPKYAYLENVPGLLSAGEVDVGDGSGRSVPYIYTILRDIAEMGMDARWGIVGCDDVGGYHKRKRLWIRAERNDWDTISNDE